MRKRREYGFRTGFIAGVLATGIGAGGLALLEHRSTVLPDKPSSLVMPGTKCVSAAPEIARCGSDWVTWKVGNTRRRSVSVIADGQLVDASFNGRSRRDAILEYSVPSGGGTKTIDVYPGLSGKFTGAVSQEPAK